MFRFAVVVAISVAVSSDWAFAQPDGAACTLSLDGHAVDAATHEPVAAATVRIGDELLATTDDAGRFTLTSLCAGTLVVVLERDDYKPTERSVLVGDDASLEVEMRPAGEVIEVRAKAPPPTEMRSTAVVSGAELDKMRGRSFSDTLAKVPGVVQLRATTGVAKPIIRGQFGRRLLLLVDGIRHRGQEWGIEHAPEIDPFIADSLSVVRGPGGVRYGADAIGGVVLVDPPELRREPGYNGEAHLIGASNGRGGTFAARLQSVLDALPALSTHLEGSVKRLAAPETPLYPIDNAGVLEWNLGATLGYRAHHNEYKLSYRHYDATLGVCSCLRVHNPDDFFSQAEMQMPIGADQFKAEFAIDRPKQAVHHDLAFARGSWDRNQLGTFTATYSFQHDLRREYDVVRQAVGDAAQFNFRLMTHELDLVFQHDPIHLSEHWHLRGAAGVAGIAQINYYGGLQLVPDYKSFGAGAYATERLISHSTEVEVGARFDASTRTASLAQIDFLRLVRSGQIAMDACTDPSKDSVACNSHFLTFTGSLGLLRRLGEAWSLRSEISIAQRAPNTDEQYLNGTAPTFPVLGLGKPDLRPETTYSSSATLAHDSESLKAEASAFVNYIGDYIYFAPAIGDDGKPIFDVLIRGTFPRFTTRAIDALFYGADGGVSWAPLRALDVAAQASFVRARDTRDHSYLVFIPADRYRAAVTYHPPALASFHGSYLTVSGMYVARQRRFDIAADFVPTPDPYFLLGAEIGTETTIADQRVKLAVEGSNLTNARYRDYTSLMRYFADEPGWQVWLRMSLFFDSTRKGTLK